jgi:signal transduction histidine kinase
MGHTNNGFEQGNQGPPTRQMEEHLAVLAHELRAPLQSIRSATTLLKVVALQNERIGQATSIIDRQITYLAQLVGDLFDCSRANLGKLPFEKRLVDLEEIVHAVVETVQPRVTDQGLILVASIPETPLLAQVDPMRLSQVLVNLLDNAVKFSRSKGRIEIKATHESNHVVISVTDQGCGIEPLLLPHIWDTFVQGTPASRSADLGIGIGLALVKRFVDLHGGTVSADSAGPGQGARFVVRLPGAISSFDVGKPTCR